MPQKLLWCLFVLKLAAGDKPVALVLPDDSVC